MLCPYCSHPNNKVVDSRTTQGDEVIRRRRDCLACKRRFTTYERVAELPFMVVKKNLHRERFDRKKVLQGIMRACEKRPVPMAKIEALVGAAETLVTGSLDGECPTSAIGELLMRELKLVDRVAYVRFASVYLDFQNERQFVQAIHALEPD
ncbi:MAG: transcriptional regulator NrdR [Bryobacterales bacterium]|nr:transcriptional regulator NrdR [Bryobacterales bacterium]